MVFLQNDPDAQNGGAPRRWHHVAGLVAGAALLAAGISFWKGDFSGRPEQPRGFGTSRQSSLTGSLAGLSARDRTGRNRLADDDGNSNRKAGRSEQSPRHSQGDSADADKVRRVILGTWEQHSTGHRVITIEEDGTASVDVTLDGVWAFTFGEKLQMDIQWKVADGQLVFKTTGGTPESSVNAITSLYGDNRVYDIIEITNQQILLEEDGEKKEPWKRVKQGKAKSKVRSTKSEKNPKLE